MPPAAILPTPAEIRDAAARIAGAIVRTPFHRSDAMSEIVGGEVWVKLECEQRTGSFKLRGATNALASLPEAERRNGVVAASAGNHGIGIATAAAALGIRANVFVPSTAPAVKRDAIAALGATVDATAANYDAAELLARELAARTGATFVGPCTGRALLAGQGTMALEILEDLPTLRTLVVGVGGGGLAAGIAGLLCTEAPSARIVGAQGERTNAMALALASGLPTEIQHRRTLADGLAGLVDAEMLTQGEAALDEIAVVSEAAIAESIAGLWVEEGVRVEGAGAAAAAALLSGLVRRVDFPAVVIVSGGNIDDAVHRSVIAGTYDDTWQ